MQVAVNCVVSINFTLQNDKGELLDASPKEAPLVYLHGGEGIIPALEACLAGKAIGEEFGLTIAPEEAFGPHQAELIVKIPRTSLPADLEPAPGMQVQAEDQQSGTARVLTVIDVSGDSVTLDANHPLAGMTLRFEGTIHDVRSATQAEIDEGRPL